MKRSPCRVCEQPIEGARIVAGGLGICADCAYLAEYGDTLRLPRNLRRGTGSKQPPQVESLFPPEKYTRR